MTMDSFAPVKSGEKETDGYREIFNEMLDYLMLIDGQTGEILEVNNIWESTTGFKKSEITGKHFSTVFCDEQIENAEELEKIMTHDSVVSSRLLRRKTGDPVPVEMSLTMVSFRGKNAILTVLRSIKERLEAEDKIMEMNKRLGELNSTKDKFFSIIAHDLKNQFNVLISFSELLLKDMNSLEEKQRFYFLSQIENVSRSTYGLLSNLLNWARSQTGKLSVCKDVVLLNDLATLVVGELAGQLIGKNLKVDFSGNALVVVYTDEEMIKTVIRNLLSNAIKFSPAGSQIEIEIREEKNHAVFRISDKGIGMDEEIQKELFKPGIRSRHGTANEAGTGIGLTLCYEFITKLNGRIWCKSAPGKGTSMFFTVELPQ